MEILFPAGRMIGGSVEKLQPVTDAKTKLPKFNPDGSPMLRCNFGVAVPKDPAAPQWPAWANSAWGQLIVGVAQTGFPKGESQRPDFAWKIIDGDSTVPNKKGNVPCKQTGYPGCWVIWFSQSWLPKLCTSDGMRELTAPGSIVAGYVVQVLGEVVPNTGDSPGVYMNPKAVALIATMEKIATDVDTTKVGFGVGVAIPAGAVPATAQPNLMGAVAAAPGAVGVAPAPAAGPYVAPGAQAAPVAAVPLQQVAPNTAYMMPPVGGAIPAAPMAPAAPAGPRMVHNAATGQTAPYDQMIANNWTDATLAQYGWAG